MNIERIKSIPVGSVAEALGIKVMGNKCRCPFHDDRHPSMSIDRKQNIAHCFVCDRSWDSIALVEEKNKLNFKDACLWIADAFDLPAEKERIPETFFQAINQKLMNTENSEYLDRNLLKQFQGSSNEFTRALVQNGILSKEQMLHAASQYHLSTAEGRVIFWQIDQNLNIREGKVMSYQADCHRSKSLTPFTISWLLKRKKLLPDDWKADYCLFGLHLLHERAMDGNTTVAVVESEKTAVICSGLIPALTASGQEPSEVIWLATGGIGKLSTQMLLPLKGRKVIIFPDTDPDGSAYRKWTDIAAKAQQELGMPVPVSDILERHATAEQKLQKIDIADLLTKDGSST